MERLLLAVELEELVEEERAMATVHAAFTRVGHRRCRCAGADARAVRFGRTLDVSVNGIVCDTIDSAEAFPVVTSVVKKLAVVVS